MSDASHTVSDLDVDLGQLFGSLLRNWLRILLAALAVAGLAWVLASLATPLYRAETRILIESRESIYTRPASAGISDAGRTPVDDEMVASQVEVIGSTDILLDVARRLDLASRDEFGAAGETSALGNLLVLIGLKSDPVQASVEERVLRAMQERLSIYRVDGSRVIVIGFSTRDPALAAAVPNAIADAYVAGQEQARRLSDADATDWLEPEIEDLRRRVRDAEARVAEYRSQAGLLIGQNNSVLPTQQLAEISTELTRVRAERAAAEARAKAISDAGGSGSRIDSMPDVLAAPLVQRLRERQVQLEADLADLSASLLDNHPRMKALRAQLDETGRQLRAEVDKVRLAAQNEAASARAREVRLAAEVNRLKAASAQAGDDEVELRALEREAAAERALLESYLTRYREAAARADRNSMPADARIFARAMPPHQAYFPRKGPIVAAAFAAALLMMSIAILLRELFSGRAMRPAAGAPVPAAVIRAAAAEVGMMQIAPGAATVSPAGIGADAEAGAEAEIGVESVGPVALAGAGPVAPAGAGIATQPARRLWDIPVDGPAAASGPVDEPVEETQTASAAAAAEPAGDEIAQPESEDDMARFGLRHDEITISAAVDRLIDGDVDRAVFISPQGDEATGTSVTVAREMADAGLRVIYVDLTWSGAPSTAMMEREGRPGVTNLLAAQARFADVIHDDAYSDCHVIPAGTADPEQAMRAIDRLPIILEALDTAYEVVVIECGATDAEAIAAVTGDHADLYVSAPDPRDRAVIALARDLEAAGYGETLVVTPDRRERRVASRGRYAVA